MNILFLGASNTDCGHCFTEDNLGNGYVKFIAERLDPKHFSVVNGGSDGFTFPRMYRKYLDFYSTRRFDAAVILGGINEAGMLADNGLNPHESQTLLDESEAALRELIYALFSNGTRQIFLLEPFLFSSPSILLSWLPAYESVRERIHACIKTFAKEPLIFVPLQNRLLSLANASNPDSVTTDGIHLAPLGHRMVADWVAQAMNLSSEIQ